MGTKKPRSLTTSGFFGVASIKDAQYGLCDRFRCKAKMRENPVFSRVSTHFLQNLDLLFASYSPAVLILRVTEIDALSPFKSYARVILHIFVL